MPLNVYLCEDGHRFELVEKMDEEGWGAVRHCPSCGKDAKRCITTPTVAPDGRYSYKSGKRVV